MARESFKLVGQSIESGHFREGIRQVFKLVEHGNRYINSVEPWKTIKTDPEKAESDLAVIGHIIKCLSVLASPFLPKGANLIADDINFDNINNGWNYSEPQKLIVNDPIPIYKRIEESEVAEQMQKLEK
jgi:methionyl-tRNA synthetase